ncbi:unnamed protein product [Protopolystoma xenopodis]|uniref:Uncharacterized protein n=1 Tax=Protopolystoma xenopodis TaxID=117903 RepID=A0A3S4ZLM8_9PLAT|nr:unnamed protein product [Protopolystoma xenopodis]
MPNLLIARQPEAWPKRLHNITENPPSMPDSATPLMDGRHVSLTEVTVVPPTVENGGIRGKIDSVAEMRAESTVEKRRLVNTLEEVEGAKEARRKHVSARSDMSVGGKGGKMIGSGGKGNEDEPVEEAEHEGEKSTVVRINPLVVTSLPDRTESASIVTMTSAMAYLTPATTNWPAGLVNRRPNTARVRLAHLQYLKNQPQPTQSGGFEARPPIRPGLVTPNGFLQSESDENEDDGQNEELRQTSQCYKYKLKQKYVPKIRPFVALALHRSADGTYLHFGASKPVWGLSSCTEKTRRVSNLRPTLVESFSLLTQSTPGGLTDINVVAETHKSQADAMFKR